MSKLIFMFKHFIVIVDATKSAIIHGEFFPICILLYIYIYISKNGVPRICLTSLMDYKILSTFSQDTAKNKNEI